jgi:hypothetical protein
MAAPLAALVVGAGLATGAYAVIDDGSAAPASKVIVVETPGPNATEIPGKDESATAAAISKSQSGELGGSKASSTGTSAQDAATALRTDPHGPASALHDR